MNNFINNNLTFKKISFLIVPLLSSLISTYHLYDFFILGNPKFVSFLLSLAFELGAIASFLYIEKIENTYNKIIFWVLFLMQIFGNVYFSFNFSSLKLIENPQWMASFREIYEIFFEVGKSDSIIKLILSLIIGLPIPIISLAFLNSYMTIIENEKNNVSIENKETINKKDMIIDNTSSNSLGENEEKVINSEENKESNSEEKKN